MEITPFRTEFSIQQSAVVESKLEKQTKNM